MDLATLITIVMGLGITALVIYSDNKITKFSIAKMIKEKEWRERVEVMLNRIDIYLQFKEK